MVQIENYLIFLSVTLVLLSPSGDSTRSPGQRECLQVGTILKNKGFTYPWWEPPLSATLLPSGCPAKGKALKCCPATFDTTSYRKEMTQAFSQKWFGSKLGAAKEIFSDRKKRFDVTFKALLKRAHTSFHSMFERTYGMLYIQHADVFHALFGTLEKYYEDGREHLESKLNEFFAILTRKMFEVLNAQYDFADSYLSCATIVISEKQGNDLHRQIVSSLRRSFVATRAFAQGLLEAERVIVNVNKLPLNSSDCLVPLSQMVTCPICTENRAYKPCLQFCSGLSSRCLSQTFFLVKPWAEFSRALEDLTDRLMGPYNVEAVVEPIHIKISEAIMNFQESGAELSQAVFSKCGKPTLKSRHLKKRGATEPRVQPAKSRENDKEDLQPNKSLEKLLRDTKGRVRKSKEFWNILPRQVCNAISKDYSSQMCWNGTSVLKIDKTNENDSTDETPIDTTPRGNPNQLITEQILILQLITDKLKTAFNGGDITWVQELDSDDEFGSGIGMGSGSGDLPTDLEDTDDDDPGGDIGKKNQKPSPPPTFNIVPPKKINLDESPEPPRRIDHPSPPIFKPIQPNHGDDEDEDDDEDDEESSNLNINSRNNNKNIPNANNDFGLVDFPPTSTQDKREPPISPTLLPTTTTHRPTTPAIRKTSETPIVPPLVHNPTLTKDNPGAKTVAVVNVFTPVIMSMLGKLFNMS